MSTPLRARCIVGLGICVAIVVGSAPAAIAGCQSGNVANNTTTFLLSSANCQATALGNEAIAVGPGAEASLLWSTATGFLALTKGVAATTLGARAGAPTAVAGATAVGALAAHGGAGIYSTAVGGGNSIAVGGMSSAAHALGGYSVAIGGGDADTFDGARAKGFRSIAIGQRSSTGDTTGFTGFGLGDFGTSVGFNTHTGFAATAVGTDAQAKGGGSTAVGRFSSASGTNAVALGAAANASQTRGVAIGNASVASGLNSVSLGYGSVAAATNVVSVGSAALQRRIINAAPAVNGTDVPNLTQVKGLIAAATAASQSSRAAQSAEATTDDVWRELLELRALVAGLKEKIAELESRNTLAQAD